MELKLLALSALATLCSSVGPAAAQARFTTLFNFAGGWATGLIMIDGSIYGSAVDVGCGNLFRLQRPENPDEQWGETVLYTFAGTGGDGCSPMGGPVPGPGGALYGLTEVGGQNDSGALYELRPPATPGSAWTESTAYSFSAVGTEGGGNPISSLTVGPSGSFYVIDSYDSGTLLRLLPPASPVLPWTGTLLSVLGGGANWVVSGPGGELYATEADGGIDGVGDGSVVKLTPPQAAGGAWTQTVLYSFGCCGAAAPGDPNTLTWGPDGTIYGTTWGLNPGIYSGAGAVFSLTPPASPGENWTHSILHYFGANHPSSPLVLHNGNLYGTAESADFTSGTVFELMPPSSSGGPWGITYLHRFTNGQVPSGQLLIDKDGVIYGMTGSPPGDAPTGTIFKIETE